MGETPIGGGAENGGVTMERHHMGLPSIPFSVICCQANVNTEINQAWDRDKKCRNGVQWGLRQTVGSFVLSPREA